MNCYLLIGGSCMVFPQFQAVRVLWPLPGLYIMWKTAILRRVMDIYRFFHPHHNPRLHRTPLRQQELAELEQAAAELRKALERARTRAARKPLPPIMPEHFDDLLKAAGFVERSLQTLCDAHPGDSPGVLLELVRERAEFPGWETWASLLREQLSGRHGLAHGIAAEQQERSRAAANGNGRRNGQQT